MWVWNIAMAGVSVNAPNFAPNFYPTNRVLSKISSKLRPADRFSQHAQIALLNGLALTAAPRFGKLDMAIR
jgi:hypothetical protein